MLHLQGTFASMWLPNTLLQQGVDRAGNGLHVLVASLELAGSAWLAAAACLLLVFGARRLGAAFADRERTTIRPG